MKLHELKPVEGARKDGFRLGRGQGSGNGKTAGKGNKGQKARSGGLRKLGFEGDRLHWQDAYLNVVSRTSTVRSTRLLT